MWECGMITKSNCPIVSFRSVQCFIIVLFDHCSIWPLHVPSTWWWWYQWRDTGQFYAQIYQTTRPSSQSFPASFWRFLQLGSACSVHHLPEYFCQHNKTDGVWGIRSNIGKVSRVQLLSFRASQQRLGQPTQWPSWARIRSTWSGQTTGTNWPSMVFFPSLSSQSPTLGNVITTFKNTVYKKHTTQSCFLSKNSWELQRCLKSSSEGFQKHDLFIGVRQTKLMVWFPASYSITQTFESLFILFIFHQLERLKLE